MKHVTMRLRGLLLALLFVVTLAPLAAAAQDVTVVEGASSPLAVGYLIGMGLLAGAGTLFGLWLSKKKGGAWDVLSELYFIAQTVVAHVDAKIRPEVTKALADGVLQPDERARIQTLALEAFKEAIGPALLKKVQARYGDGVNTVLSGILEWALKKWKTPGVVTPAPAPSSAAVVVAHPQ